MVSSGCMDTVFCRLQRRVSNRGHSAFCFLQMKVGSNVDDPAGIFGMTDDDPTPRAERSNQLEMLEPK